MYVQYMLRRTRISAYICTCMQNAHTQVCKRNKHYYTINRTNEYGMGFYKTILQRWQDAGNNRTGSILPAYTGRLSAGTDAAWHIRCNTGILLLSSRFTYTGA